MATRIYTKTGDDGTTGLFGGGRVPKYHLRIEAYGTVDELNSVLGCVLALPPECALPSDMHATLTDISALLFTLGADLATPLSPPPSYPIPRIEARHIEYLELLIDRYDEELGPLKAFILPTGTQAAAYLHLARTICRRAERITVQLAREEPIGNDVLRFLNRLSDYCFTAARLANKRASVPDVLWRNPEV